MCRARAHASMKVILDMMKDSYTNQTLEIDGMSRGGDYKEYKKTLMFNEGSDLDVWLNGLFTKVCVSTDSEESLELLYYKAKEQGIPCSIIEDAGLTEFNGVPTKTCIAIGPAGVERINKLTGHLKLL